MKKTPAAFAALLVAATLAGPALAQDVTFADVDADSSGGLSFTEVTAKHGDVTQEQFNQVDANADGALNAEEYTALIALTASTTVSPGTIQQDTPRPAN